MNVTHFPVRALGDQAIGQNMKGDGKRLVRKERGRVWAIKETHQRADLSLGREL
jgi:hypothetical protein